MTLDNLVLLFNIFLLESMLSLDNAAVLAIMVGDLPPGDRSKALKYGILGAFVFRGLCLFVAVWLVKIIWLKILGGAYLIYLVYKQYAVTPAIQGEDQSSPRKKHLGENLFGAFWSTVLMVEIMDIAFSLDNIFAASAMTSNIYLILTGVFMGIVAMRFVAQFFTFLIERYPSLQHSAFVVIFLLGLKLIIAGAVHYDGCFKNVDDLFSSHSFDSMFSVIMMFIFVAPILWRKK